MYPLVIVYDDSNITWLKLKSKPYLLLKNPPSASGSSIGQNANTRHVITSGIMKRIVTPHYNCLLHIPPQKQNKRKRYNLHHRPFLDH